MQNIVGQEFDKAYIMKVTKRTDWDFDKTINDLLDYKEKQNEKEKTKKTETETKKSPMRKDLGKISQNEEMLKAIPLINEKKSSVSFNKNGTNLGDNLITDSVVNMKNVRKLSKDDMKELPLIKNNWNKIYPTINYPEYF